MIKSKRKVNKQRIVDGSRVYVIVSNDGPLQHFFKLGTLVRRDYEHPGLTAGRGFTEVTSDGYPLSQNLRPEHYN